MHSACASLPLSSRAMWWPPRMGLLQMAHGPADVDAVLASSASSVPGGRAAAGVERGVHDGLPPALDPVVAGLDDGDATRRRAALSSDGERALAALRGGRAVDGDDDLGH